MYISKSEIDSLVLQEQAKPILNGYYITREGSVISLRGHKKDILGKILKHIISSGYPSVNLNVNGKYSKIRIHRLVAQAFIPNPNSLPFVNHKNEIKTDNRVENLEWCTHTYNNNYGSVRLRSALKNGNKVIQFDIAGNFIKIWRSYSSTNKCGFNGYKLGICAESDRIEDKVHRGYIWHRMDSDTDILSIQSFLKLHLKQHPIERSNLDMKIAKYSVNGVFLDIKDKSTDYGSCYTSDCITMCCRREINIHKGFTWRYVENVEDAMFKQAEIKELFRKKPPYTRNRTSRKVFQYTLEKTFIKEWESTKECQKYGYNRTAIYNCCNGVSKYHNGFVWSFKKF